MAPRLTGPRRRKTSAASRRRPLGVLLARPGLDREHLYVGMTRGRHANHVHLTIEPTDDETHRPPGTAPTLDDAVRVLQTATARVGARQAALCGLGVASDS